MGIFFSPGGTFLLFRLPPDIPVPICHHPGICGLSAEICVPSLGTIPWPGFVFGCPLHFFLHMLSPVSFLGLVRSGLIEDGRLSWSQSTSGRTIPTCGCMCDVPSPFFNGMCFFCLFVWLFICLRVCLFARFFIHLVSLSVCLAACLSVWDLSYIFFNKKIPPCLLRVLYGPAWLKLGVSYDVHVLHTGLSKLAAACAAFLVLWFHWYVLFCQFVWLVVWLFACLSVCSFCWSIWFVCLPVWLLACPFVIILIYISFFLLVCLSFFFGLSFWLSSCFVCFIRITWA